MRRAAHAAFFALLPAAATAGGLALAATMGLAGTLSASIAPLRRAANFANPAAAIILIFLGWAALSALWSPFADHGQAVRLAAIAATGLAFAAAAGADPNARRLTRAAGLAAFCVLIALLAIEAAFDMPLNRMALPGQSDWLVARNPGRGASVLAVIAWGVAGALLMRSSWTGRAGAAVVLAAALLLAGQFMQTANLIAMGAGFIAFVAGWAAPAGAIRITFGVFAAWTMLAPFAAHLLLSNRTWLADAPYAAAIRAETWAYASQRIFERPLFGHGLDASRTMSDQIVFRGAHEDLMPLHPHSASLHIWLETGALGAFLIAAALLFMGRDLARALAANRAAAASACATCVAFGLLANCTYGAWQEWWIAAACLGAALVSAIRGERRAA